jgi:Sulfotransferase family
MQGCGKEIGQDKWNEYFSFAFVRNPFDRLVSWYAMIEDRFNRLSSHQQQAQAPFDSPFWNHAVRDAHDFDSFLTNCTQVISEKGCKKSYAYNQLDYMSDENGNNAMSFVGRYENLASDMEVVFAKLGVSGKKLPKKIPAITSITALITTLNPAS